MVRDQHKINSETARQTEKKKEKKHNSQNELIYLYRCLNLFKGENIT